MALSRITLRCIAVKKHKLRQTDTHLQGSDVFAGIASRRMLGGRLSGQRVQHRQTS